MPALNFLRTFAALRKCKYLRRQSCDMFTLAYRKYSTSRVLVCAAPSGVLISFPLYENLSLELIYGDIQFPAKQILLILRDVKLN
jgi:hypothetical protein